MIFLESCRLSYNVPQYVDTRNHLCSNRLEMHMAEDANMNFVNDLVIDTLTYIPQFKTYIYIVQMVVSGYYFFWMKRTVLSTSIMILINCFFPY